VDLHLDFLDTIGIILSFDDAPLRDSCVGVVIESLAGATIFRESAASAARVDGTGFRVNMRAKALLGFRGAGQVRLAGIERRRPVVLDELVGSSVRASVARTCHIPATVQQPLDRKVDVIPLALPLDLDAVGEGGERGVGPA